MPTDKEPKSALYTWFQIGGLIVGVIALLATVFFAVRSESTKEVTVTYPPKRPLVSIEGARASAGLEVRLGGNPIAAPWLVSGRLQNTGNQPIQERDVEAPAKFSFKGAKIVSAEIVQKSDPAIFADASARGNDVTIEHKLLNPGDWVTFDIVFDGEPEMPPSVTFRISGVAHVKQRDVSLGESRAYPAVVPLPTPLLYLMLAIGSFAGVAVVIGGLALLAQVIGNIFPGTRKMASTRERLMRLDPSMLAGELSPSSPAARTICAVLGQPLSLGLLDQPEALRKTIEQGVPLAVLQAFGLDAQRAATTLGAELKENLRDVLAWRIYRALTPGSDRAAQAAFRKLDVVTMSTGDLVKRATDAIAEPWGSVGPLARIDTGELGAGLVLLVIGLCLILLLGGTWRMVLAG